MPHLFDPIQFRDLTLQNRVIVSPMCQYASTDGFATDWHLVHLGSRAVASAALVFTEATAVTAEGRISPQDLGIWKDEQIDMLARIVAFIHSQQTTAGIQLAHAGRKGSTIPPWKGEGAVPPDAGGWIPVGPSDRPFAPGYPVPRTLDRSGITAIVGAFADAATRARLAGFDVAEIHAAHGYLLNSFLSPLTNDRADEYGGSFENRIRLLLEVVDAVRRVWPERLPVFLRISATDWVEGGWDVDQSVELARLVRERGVDLIDCSSGGLVKTAIPVSSGYQVPFAEKIRRDAQIPTGAVGLINEPQQANAIVVRGQADVILLARALLRDPYWPAQAAAALGETFSWPVRYARAALPGWKVRTHE